jgi:hypothetical protein
MKGTAKDHLAFSSLIATLMTIMVLLVTGSVLYLMVIDVTPNGTPAIGALTSTRNDSGNYTIKVMALTNSEITLDEVSIVINPDNSPILTGKMIGTGDRLSPGDSFTVSNLHPGITYTIQIRYQATGSVIASLEVSAY